MTSRSCGTQTRPATAGAVVERDRHQPCRTRPELGDRPRPARRSRRRRRSPARGPTPAPPTSSTPWLDPAQRLLERRKRRGAGRTASAIGLALRAARRRRSPGRARACTTRSSSSADLGVARRPSPPAGGAAARRRSPAPRCAGCGPGAPPASPPPRCRARCSSIFSASSATPSPRGRLGAQDRHLPAVRVVGEREHAADLAHHRVGHRVVGLVDDEDIGDLEQARLDRLDVVTEAGHRDDDGGVGGLHHLDLVLADSDRLDQHALEAHRIEHVRDVERGALPRARRTRPREAIDADEHPGIEHVLGDPDPIAEHGPACERARRVDRQHPDLAPRPRRASWSAPR